MIFDAKFLAWFTPYLVLLELMDLNHKMVVAFVVVMVN